MRTSAALGAVNAGCPAVDDGPLSSCSTGVPGARAGAGEGATQGEATCSLADVATEATYGGGADGGGKRGTPVRLATACVCCSNAFTAGGPADCSARTFAVRGRGEAAGRCAAAAAVTGGGFAGLGEALAAACLASAGCPATCGPTAGCPAGRAAAAEAGPGFGITAAGCPARGCLALGTSVQGSG